MATSYLKQAQSALMPLTGLSRQMHGDLDEEAGGIAWWHGQLAQARNIMLTDYALGLLHTVETDVQEAAFHRHAYNELTTADQFSLADALRSARARGEVGPPARDVRSQERSVEIVAHVAGFFRAVGSALDSSAAAMLVVGGARLRTHRADFNDLKHLWQTDDAGLRLESRSLMEAGSAGGQEQRGFYLGLEGVFMCSPDGWARWSVATRNMLVHRARRLDFMQYRENSGQSQARLFRPLPRDPDMTDVEAMLVSRGELRDFLLDEDGRDTMSGVFSSVLAAVHDAFTQAVTMWDLRRAQPELVPAHDEQWPAIRPGLASGFDGYGGVSLPPPQGTAFVNPDRERRLRAARLFDDRRGEWTRGLEVRRAKRPGLP